MQWQRWLTTNSPLGVNEVKIEGVWGSNSTLLLISLPLNTWSALAAHPSCTFVGMVHTPNLIDGRNRKPPLMRQLVSHWRYESFADHREPTTYSPGVSFPTTPDGSLDYRVPTTYSPGVSLPIGYSYPYYGPFGTTDLESTPNVTADDNFYRHTEEAITGNSFRPLNNSMSQIDGTTELDSQLNNHMKVDDDYDAYDTNKFLNSETKNPSKTKAKDPLIREMKLDPNWPAMAASLFHKSCTNKFKRSRVLPVLIEKDVSDIVQHAHAEDTDDADKSADVMKRRKK